MLTTTTELAKSALQCKDKELLTRSQLARRLNMSDQTLKRQLAVEGVSYKSLAQGIREKKACDLLRSAELTMEEISDNLGYSNVANFYRAFKSWTGKTPLGYRRGKGVIMNVPFCPPHYFNISLTSGMLVFAASMERYFFYRSWF